MPDFNRTEHSALPVNTAINVLLEQGGRIDPEQTRGYLGASAVGHPCMRQIQYTWLCDPAHALRTRDIFARGHFFEAQTREHFTRAGFTFAEPDRLAFEALDGWLRGHADGIFLNGPKIQGVKYPCLWENKCINAKGWRSLDRDGLEKTYPQYAAQVALYQQFLATNDHPAIFTCVNADSVELLHLLVPFDAERARAWIERAQTIINATRAGELLPRFTEDPDHWRCRLCGHKERCWR
ncbi:MAG TPA: hypothetical protein VM822_01160 [Pseudolabrys sp.]|jgi:hypothetical protein|nr:hypothetical protein [Pseudolabrys sp.]